jgi:gamma-butyrobetaine dioxygenase
LFGRRVGWLVGAHVAAKRYLVATDPTYAALLSPASVASLGVQGGPMTPEEVAAFNGVPDAPAAAALRRWDDAAKVPGAPVPDLDLLERCFGRTLLRVQSEAKEVLQ